METLICSIDKVIPNQSVGYGNYMDIIISGRAYKKERKFLGFQLRPKYYYTLNIPQIKVPRSYGDLELNRIMEFYSIIIKQLLIDEIHNFKQYEKRNIYQSHRAK